MSDKPNQIAASPMSPEVQISVAAGAAPGSVVSSPPVHCLASAIRHRLLDLLDKTMTAETVVSWLNNRKKSWGRLCKSGAGPKPVTRVRKRDEPLQYARHEVVDALMRCLFCMPEPPSERE